MASRLVLALDETDPARALQVAKGVSPFVSKIKINYPLVLSAGLEIVTEISKFSPVICDFKVADIPNTNRLIAEAAHLDRGCVSSQMEKADGTDSDTDSQAHLSDDEDIFNMRCAEAADLPLSYRESNLEKVRLCVQKFAQ